MATVKRLLQNSLIGQEGINLIERILSGAGLIWRPTSIHDTGIDGTIEMRDSTDGRVTNLILQVQSKATAGRFESESDSGFTFRVSESDLEYWLGGNLPVILVVSRPSSNEAYWVSVKDYFSSESRRSERKVVFDKHKNKFDESVVPALWTLSTNQNGPAGLYHQPIPIRETLLSNLLEIQFLPTRLFVATALVEKPAEVKNLLQNAGVYACEWVLHNKQLLSVHDLSLPAFASVCDKGTVEDFDVSEWSESEDVERVNQFKHLLAMCLLARLDKKGVAFQPRKPFRLFYFIASEDLKPRIFAYRSAQKMTKREVFRAYLKKKDNSLSYYRHSAMRVHFHRFDEKWFAEINPTYYFTWKDGRLDLFHDEHLSGIKRLERNGAVKGQLLMWAALLTDRGDLLEEDYPHLRFAALASGECPVTLDDEIWLSGDEFDNRGEDQSVLSTESTMENQDANQLSLGT